MSSMQMIQDFLGQKRLAVVGVSRQPKDFSLALFRELRKRGYDAVPVNPQAEQIDEQPCYARLQAVHPPVDGALLMTSPAATDVGGARLRGSGYQAGVDVSRGRRRSGEP